MKQPEDRFTADWVATETGNAAAPKYPGRGGKPGRRGAYAGAYAGAFKQGSENMRLRVKTGKTQAEFAELAGISERTLRTWETTGDVALKSSTAILAALKACGVDWQYELDVVAHRATARAWKAGAYRRHVERCRAP